ncbi:hypothetical protein VTJ83DRAFT_3134 [Remersonia thermophila]|uniref:Retrotransposon gag domain-containing protein n=1 Tax=Remersonia thermophila TaxID=72144 RepID=A0ABR4DD57_9PEZI
MLGVFLYECERIFNSAEERYRLDRSRIQFGASCLTGTLKLRWSRHYLRRTLYPTLDGPVLSWEDFVRFLEERLWDSDSAALPQLTQREDEKVTEFIDRYIAVYANYFNAITEADCISNLVSKLRPEISQAIINKGEPLPTTLQGLETLLNASTMRSTLESRGTKERTVTALPSRPLFGPHWSLTGPGAP